MNTTPPRPPRPGTPEAGRQGCICRADQRRQVGHASRYWVAAECSLHGINTVTRQERL